jgi:hypothetical protein
MSAHAALTVDRDLLWILMAVCCAPAVLVVAATRLRAVQRDGRPPRLAYVGAAVDGVLTGVGIGLSVALVVLLLAAGTAALGA